jgi:hypothetical protein
VIRTAATRAEEDEQVREDVHRRLQHSPQDHCSSPYGSSGRRPPGRRHVLDEFGVLRLRVGVVARQRRSDLLDHPNALAAI